MLQEVFVTPKQGTIRVRGKVPNPRFPGYVN